MTNQLLWALVVMRLGAFVAGLAGFGVANYFNWPYAGWILVPTVIAGLMCSSLSYGALALAVGLVAFPFFKEQLHET